MEMSERRFWFVIDKGKLEYVQDNVTNEKITVTELEDLLNELYDENDQLRLLLKERQYEKDISKCREENIKLQQVLSENEKMLQNDLDMLTELRRENKQLRQTIKTQQIRIYCQDKEIQKLNEQLNKIPNTIKEVWLE